MSQYCNLFQQVLLIAGTWGILITLVTGIGFLLFYIIGKKTLDKDTFFDAFWAGFCFLLAFLQIWHFAFKIGPLTIYALIVLGILGIAISFNTAFKALYNGIKNNKILFGFTLIIAVWVANVAAGPAKLTDTGLYHQQMVKWSSSYPVVPGLGNLHDRFAFNSSFYNYGALISSTWWGDNAFHVAVGVLFLVLIAYALISIKRLFESDTGIAMSDLYYAILFGPLLAYMDYFWLASMSPDPAIYILMIVLTGKAISYFTGPYENKRGLRFMLIYSTALVLTGITIKLSFLIYGACLLFFVYLFVYLKKDVSDRINRVSIPIITLVIFIFIPWVVTGYLLSGYPFFPSTVGSLDFIWTMPKQTVADMNLAIRAWAKIEKFTNYGYTGEGVMNSRDWLAFFLDNMKVRGVNRLLQIVLFSYVISFFVKLRNAEWSERYTFLSVNTALVVGILYWLVMAPMYRFSGSLFIILAAMALVHLFYRFLDNMSAKTAKIVAAALLVFIWIESAPLVDKVLFVPPPRGGGCYTQPHVLVGKSLITDSEQYFNFPFEGNRCWNAPLPCVIEYKYGRGIRLIRPNDLSSGFYIPQ